MARIAFSKRTISQWSQWFRNKKPWSTTKMGSSTGCHKWRHRRRARSHQPCWWSVMQGKGFNSTPWFRSKMLWFWKPKVDWVKQTKSTKRTCHLVKSVDAMKTCLKRLRMMKKRKWGVWDVTWPISNWIPMLGQVSKLPRSGIEMRPTTSRPWKTTTD